MVRKPFVVTIEVVEKMTAEDIAKLSKKQRRAANDILEKIIAKKEAETRTEQLRLANIEKERKRLEGIEKKRLDKEKQLKKDDERHRLVSKEIAKMTEAITFVTVVKASPSETEEFLPFPEALAKLLTTSFRTSIPGHQVVMFDKLTSMSTLEVAETLLHNGFSLEPPHRIDYIISEVLSRSHRGKLSRDFVFLDKKEYEQLLKKGSPEARLFTTLAFLIYEADWKYSKAFIPPEQSRGSKLLGVMSNLKTFLVVNRIPWRETHLLDIVKAIEDPIGRLVRLGRTFEEDQKCVFHDEECDCEIHSKTSVREHVQLALKHMKERNSYHWPPLMPPVKISLNFAHELFEACCKGISIARLQEITSRRASEVYEEQIDDDSHGLGGIENSREEKNQRKSEKRYEGMTAEIAKMTKAIESALAIAKTPIQEEEPLPFHEELVNFLEANSSFRSSLSKDDNEILDILTKMSESEITDILLRNGFSLKPRHAVEFVIKEVLAGGLASKSFCDFRLEGERGTKTDKTLYFDWFSESGSLLEKLLINLIDVLYLGDIKYISGFLAAKKACSHKQKQERHVRCLRLLQLMDNVRMFLFVKRIPWRETRLVDIIKIIEDPEERVVRLGRSLTEDWPNACHPKRCDCPTHIDQDITLPEKHAQKYIKKRHSSKWCPLVPKDMKKEIAATSKELFEKCSEGIPQ